MRILKFTLAILLTVLITYVVTLAIMQGEVEYSGHPSTVKEFEEAMSNTFLRLWLLQNTAVGMLWGQLNKVLEKYNNTYFAESEEVCPKLLTDIKNFKVKPSDCVSIENGSSGESRIEFEKRLVQKADLGEEVETLTRQLWLGTYKVEDDVEWEWEVYRKGEVCLYAFTKEVDPRLIEILKEKMRWVNMSFCQKVDSAVPLRPVRMWEKLCPLGTQIAKLLGVERDKKGEWHSKTDVFVKCHSVSKLPEREELIEEAKTHSEPIVKRLVKLLEDANIFYSYYKLNFGGNTTWNGTLRNVTVYLVYNVLLRSSVDKRIKCCTEEDGNASCTETYWKWDVKREVKGNYTDTAGWNLTSSCVEPPFNIVNVPVSIEATSDCEYVMTVKPFSFDFLFIVDYTVPVNVTVEQLGVGDCTKKHNFFRKTEDVCRWLGDCEEKPCFKSPFIFLDVAGIYDKSGNELRAPAQYREEGHYIYILKFRLTTEEGSSEPSGEAALNIAESKIKEAVNAKVEELLKDVLETGKLWEEVPWSKKLTCEEARKG
ncbi:MAG: hypothetical protein QXK42_00470 [Candidatus Korarchaeum sp.]